MPALLILVLGFSPGIFWLWLIYKKDKYRPEPVALVVRTFLLGAAVAIPVSLMEYLLYPSSTEALLDKSADLRVVAYVSFIVAGLTEELGKYLVVKKTIYGSPYFDEPMDGLVYASAAALGFASLENVGYMFSLGAEVVLLRGPFSTLAHVLFSGMWGYALGRQKLHHRTGGSIILLSLMGSMVLHGLFDFVLLAQRGYEAVALLLFVGGGILFLSLLALADKTSPYKGKVATLAIVCPACGNTGTLVANFCTRCGARLAGALQDAATYCSQCLTIVRREERFCRSCGSRLNRKLKRLATQWTSSS